MPSLEGLGSEKGGFRDMGFEGIVGEKEKIRVHCRMIQENL
jgi:hypothetical protein